MTLDELKHAIETIVAYNWSAEERDYRQNPPDEPGKGHHIFETLIALDNFVTGEQNTPANFGIGD
jgi:hypothetical protein